MEHKTYDLLVTVLGRPGIDNEDLDEMSRLLSQELDELDHIDSVEPVTSGNLPAGAKGSAIDIGSVLIKIAEAGGFTALVSFFGSWLSRDTRRSLKLSIGGNSMELTGLTKVEQGELVKWFQLQTGLRLDL